MTDLDCLKRAVLERLRPGQVTAKIFARYASGKLDMKIWSSIHMMFSDGDMTIV